MSRIFKLFADGGPIMYPLLLASVVIWGIITVRMMRLRAIAEDPYELACRLVNIYQAEGLQSCQAFLGKQSGWLAGRLKLWLSQRPAQPLSSLILEMREQLYQPTSGMLRALLQAAPLLGLLGTVVGMMQTFDVLSAMGVASPAPLSGGIAQALITTQAGLSIALAGILGTTLLDRAARRRLSSLDRAEIVLTSLKGVQP